MNRPHIQNFRITAAEKELFAGRVMRKSGIPEFSTKPTEVEKHFVEAEAELKKIEATRKKGDKK